MLSTILIVKIVGSVKKTDRLICRIENKKREVFYMKSSPVVWTIGHSNLSLEQFIPLLTGNGIQTLVDVRSIPNSRHVPQFNRKRLSAAMAQAGIDYVYLGDVLGGRPQDPSVYRSGRLPRSWAEVTDEIDYEEVMRKPWY